MLSEISFLGRYCMSTIRTRRQIILQGAGLAAGSLALGLRRPRPAWAQSPVQGADLSESGMQFARGEMDGAGMMISAQGPVLQGERANGRFTSAVIASPMPFTHVGLHYRALAQGGPAAGCQFELRTSADGSAWAAWTPVRPDCGSDGLPGDETFGQLQYAGRARFIQYRCRFPMTGGISPRVQRVTCTVIDSPPTAAGTPLRTVTLTDPATGRQIAVTPRELWLADERWRYDDAGAEIWPAMFVPVKKLVVHHTATRNDYATVDEAAAEVRAIYYFHAITRGWGDIGYHAIVDKFGNLYEGRYGRGQGVSREMLSPDVVAGHVFYHNYGSAGVALLGDATLSDWPMTAPEGPMWTTLARISTFAAGRSFLRPLRPGAGGKQAGPADRAVSDFLRSDNVWHDALANVSGHRESFDTECPGDLVMDLLPALCTAIDRGMAETSRTGVVVEAADREAAVGDRVRFRVTVEPPEPGWRVAAVDSSWEGWYKPPESEDIDYLSGYTSGPQPHQAWTRLEGAGEAFTLQMTPAAPGQHTLHVRVVVQRDLGKQVVQRVAAYAGRHTLLVRPK
jgi:hypothetical protein